jgi:hypothetical protein
VSRRARAIPEIDSTASMRLQKTTRGAPSFIAEVLVQNALGSGRDGCKYELPQEMISYAVMRPQLFIRWRAQLKFLDFAHSNFYFFHTAVLAKFFVVEKILTGET